MTMHFFDFGEQSINKRELKSILDSLKFCIKISEKLSLRENNGKCVTQKEKTLGLLRACYV